MSSSSILPFPTPGTIFIPTQTRRGEPFREHGHHFYVIFRIPRPVAVVITSSKLCDTVIAAEVEESPRKGCVDITVTVVDVEIETFMASVANVFQQANMGRPPLQYYSGVGAGAGAVQR